MKTAPLEPPRTRDEYIHRHLAFNLIAFLIDGSGWWLGMSFLSVQTILPYFVRELGGGDLLIGLLPSVLSLGYMLPQLFVAPLTERRRIQKHAVLRLAWFERIPFGLLALLTFLLAKPAPAVLLGLFFLCMAANAFIMGSNMPGYSTMFSKSIPADKRGRLWGISGAVGGVIGLAGAFYSKLLLERYGMPLGFTYCFLLGFVVLLLTVAPLGWVREPEGETPPSHGSFREHWTEAWKLLGQYPGFRRLLMAEWLFALASTASAFYTVDAVERFHAGSGAVGQFNVTVIAASVLGGFLWGTLSDRYGNRSSLLCSASLKMMAPLLALCLPSLGWYPAIFFLSALAGGAFELANFNILLEYSGESKVATFQGVRSLTVLPAWVLFPLLGGALAKVAGHGAIFLLSVAAGCGAAVMLLFVPDPRHRPVGYTSAHPEILELFEEPEPDPAERAGR